MINYYRDMWKRRSELLAPLTELCSAKVKWQWTEKHTEAFERIKKVISHEVLLAYPNFNEPFTIHTDASDYQLGAVIAQNNQPIAYYSRKLTPAQRRYTTTERELLAIVETLKEFRNILLGQRITVYTDHKNLTYKNFTTDRVMRWRLILEEYSPNLIYLAGEKNIVADGLSRLHYQTPGPLESYTSLLLYNSELHDADDIPQYPMRLSTLQRAQQADTELLNKVKADRSKRYSITAFRGGGRKRLLITLHKKIVVPKVLQRSIVQWYHINLCHPGETRTEQTIRQHFTWTNLRATVHDICSKCATCQTTKRSTQQYGLLPAKQADINPWDKLCVDMIGPYTIKNKKTNSTTTLQCVTMIDPATNWFEIQLVKEKDAGTIANIVEQTWLTRYPLPQELVYDRGTEFMGIFAKMVSGDYGIKRRPITVRNPQANSMIERIHQTMGNMIRTFELHNDPEITDEALSGLISAVAFALRATHHTTLNASPMQAVFGRDAIMNVKFQADWKYIQDRKQQMINYNNKRENRKRIPHTYSTGDKVLLDVRGVTKSKYGSNPFEGPYVVQGVNDNGTVILKMGSIIDTVNIRNVKPYRE